MNLYADKSRSNGCRTYNKGQRCVHLFPVKNNIAIYLAFQEATLNGITFGQAILITVID
jgi:hypothetical protein